MDIKLNGASLGLEPRRPLRVQAASGMQVRCRSGSVWVTQEGDHKDYIVPAGGTLTLCGKGYAVVHAMTPALVDLADGPCTPRGRWMAAAAQALGFLRPLASR